MGENDYIKLSLGGQPYEFMIPADVAQHIRRKDNLLRELVELNRIMQAAFENEDNVNYEPEMSAEEWIAEHENLNKKAKQEIGDE